jgi:hypothetical protein
VTIEEQLVKLNLGSKEEPKEVLINAILPSVFQAQIKKVLVEYIDVFAWSYKELKGIPKEVCEHKIELMVNVQSIKQKKKNIMNPNYALRVKEDLDKLLNARFIYFYRNHPMVIPFSNCAKEKWQIVYMCGLSKIKCPNQERSIFVTFPRFSP